MVKPFLSENACFFNFFQQKVKLVDEMMQSAYSCVTLHVKYKKLPFLAVFPWFLILSKIQDGSQDGDHSEWRHRPPAAPPLIKYTSSWEDQRLSAEGKTRFEILQHNSGKGFHQPFLPPPPPLYHGGGMNLRVRPRVKLTNTKFRVAVRWSR